ncbi:MAG TPA: VOC family protein [Saprospiraceae bacterium]|nr:VOC family protein [Saprospiraceae bacterium]HQW56069.1 VOC family protein [Saprospiraceae bacterium]
MLTHINPKLPMRNKAITQDYYCNQLGFEIYGEAEYPHYLMVEKDRVQIHFFLFEDLDPAENYGQVYIRTDDIDLWYHTLLEHKVAIHPNGDLQTKPWGQREFAILDPDNNLLTFGQIL